MGVLTMMNRLRFIALCVSSFLLLPSSLSFSSGKSPTPIVKDVSNGRRKFLASSFAAVLFTNQPANAATDCFTDCFKNCKLIAPKDPYYCKSSCTEYCLQTDRIDGLSGSVSSAGGETGIFGTNTVLKGEDKPPQVKIP